MSAPYEVHLTNAGNPDHGEDPTRPVAGTPVAHWEPVINFAEASRVCREYLTTHDLGSGNWSGGAVRERATGAIVGHVSYNGTVWPQPPGSISGQTPLYDPAAAPRARP